MRFVMTQFSEMSLAELVSARDQIDTLIKQKKSEEANNLLKEFQERADSLGIDLNELVGTKGKKKKSGSKLPAKYQNPDNKSETWSGQGRQPKWVRNQMSQGKNLEDLAIS